MTASTRGGLLLCALVSWAVVAACGDSGAGEADVSEDAGPITTTVVTPDASDDGPTIDPPLTFCDDDAGCPESLPICGADGHCIACLDDADCLLPYLRCHRDACVPRLCEPGMGWCGIAEVLFCQGDAASWDAEPCAACDDGVCAVCGPGEPRCAGHAVLRCRDDQLGFEVVESCPDGWVCDVDECRVCYPDSARCVGDVAERCDDAGEGWTVEADCAAGFTTCEAGACVPCEPGAGRCVSGGAQTCSEDGLWVAAADCWASGRACWEGACVLPCHLPDVDGADDSPGCDYWAVDLDQADPEAYHALAIALAPTGADDAPFGIDIANVDPAEAISAYIFRAHALVQVVDVPLGEVVTVPLEGNPGVTGSSRGLPAWGVRVSGPAVLWQHNPLDPAADDPWRDTVDSSTLIPASELGTEYLTLGFLSDEARTSHVTIVGTHPGTEVTVTPTAPIEGDDEQGIPATTPGITRTFFIDAGEVLSLESFEPSEIDLSGTRVSASWPVAVFVATECATLPLGYDCCCDHLEEQLPSIDTWTDEVVGARLQRRRPHGGELWRIIAAEDETEVVLEPAVTPTKILAAGEFMAFTAKDPFVVQASGPVLLAHTPKSGQKNVNTVYPGDPSLTLRVPWTQLRTRYVVRVPAGWPQTWLAIYADVDDPVKIDGGEIEPAAWSVIGDTAWRHAVVEVQAGVHEVVGAKKFGLIHHGYDTGRAFSIQGGRAAHSLVGSVP